MPATEADGLVVTRGDGYELRINEDQLDVMRFRRLVAAADLASVGEHPAAPMGPMDLLARALRCWSGPLLAGMPAWLRQYPVAVDTARLRAYAAVRLAELSADTEGRIEEVVTLLQPVAADEPLHEALQARMMLALAASGQRAAALLLFDRLRVRLADELGVHPGPLLQSALQRILHQRVAPTHRPASPALGPDSPPGPRVVPAQLPPRTTGFAGRSVELAILDSMLRAPDPAGDVRVALLTGMPGVGKTALAVRAGTSAAVAFPDGQLYVDLDGAAARPTAPIDVLGGFLRALGVDAGRMPADLAGRTAEFRSRTVGRRVLVVLDNAAGEDQVEPLLTAEPACATIVTSRHALPGFDTPVRVPVTPLPDDVGHEVLANVAGRERLATDSPSVSAVLRACAGIPLALRIAGARLATQPALSLPEIAGRLSDDSRKLTELAVGNRSVRRSFDASFHLLTDLARSALVGLARIDCPTFAAWLLAPLINISLDHADEIVDELLAMHLLEPAVPGPDRVPRYQFHDLVRAYCRGADRQLDPVGYHTLVGWSVAVTAYARQGIKPYARCTLVEETAANLGSDVLTRIVAEPRTWVAAENATLLAVLDLAARLDLRRAATALLISLRVLLVRMDVLDHCGQAAAQVGHTAGQDACAVRTLTEVRPL